MFNKEAISATSTMAAIKPPSDIIAPLKTHFSEDVWKAGPHVTLAYLGKTNKGQFIDIAMCLNKIMKDLRPIELGIEGAGCFRGEDCKVRLALVNGVGLDIWALAVRSALKKEGLLPPIEHGFLPHMTLAYEDGIMPENWEKPIIAVDQKWTCSQIILSRGLESKMVYDII